ncbi:MAG: molybdenum cofactor carrier protein [Nitrospirae bacterium]|nr:MAG: molybdenum cofactor carrier protein [Nitrospirota bacterium]
MRHRRPIVGVIGSGEHEWAERAVPLGTWLATQNVHLLTGGGKGVMASVSQAFFEVTAREGLVLAILPGREGDQQGGLPEGYPNPWVEVPIVTHLPYTGVRGQHPLSRNHIIVLSSTVLVALPGSEGTLSEIALALRYRRPIVAFCDHREEFPGLPARIPIGKTLAEIQAFVRVRIRELFGDTDDGAIRHEP